MDGGAPLKRERCGGVRWRSRWEVVPLPVSHAPLFDHFCWYYFAEFLQDQGRSCIPVEEPRLYELILDCVEPFPAPQ